MILGNKKKDFLNKSDVPSGRQWTEVEQRSYYDNFRKEPFSTWKFKVMEIFSNNGCLNESQHDIKEYNKLEDVLYESYKNDMTPDEVFNNKKHLFLNNNMVS